MALPETGHGEPPSGPDDEIRRLRRELAVLRLRRRNARRVARTSQALMRPFEYLAVEFVIFAALAAVVIGVMEGLRYGVAFAVIVIGGSFLTMFGFRFWNALLARRGLEEAGRIRAPSGLEGTMVGPIDDQIRDLEHRLRLLKAGPGGTPAQDRTPENGSKP